MFAKFRRGYFFGYGADRDAGLIRAVTGHKPHVVGEATLEGYELRIQRLKEVTDAGVNPQKILQNAWGEEFQSYVIVPNPEASVKGTLYRLSLRDRHLIDAWELVEEGWYNKAFVNVHCMRRGKLKSFRTETQVLAPGQVAKLEADGIDYRTWLMPKHRMLALAAAIEL